MSGTLDVTGAEIADIILGSVRSDGYFRDALLSFENIEIPSIEPIRGNGFVDFHEKDTLYKFTAQAKRAEVNQVFKSMQRLKLGFGIPGGAKLERARD